MNTLIKSLLCVCAIGINGCINYEPTFNIPDPEGTKRITLQNNASEYIQFDDYRITLDKNNNFVSRNGLVAFYCYGKTDYLLSIDSLFPSDWHNAIAVLPKYGYAVRLGEKGCDGYARIIVTEYTEDDKGISGAGIKYEYPWHPINEETIIYTENDPHGDHNGSTHDLFTTNLDDCDNTTKKCFEVKYSYGDASGTMYLWSTEYELVEMLKESMDFLESCTYAETTVHSEESCNEMNHHPGDDDPPVNDYDDFWNNSTWHFVGTMTCDGDGEQEFTITFHDVNHKIYSSDLYTKYWLATSLKWEDYGGSRITLRGYDDGGHTSFDFDYKDANTVECEYHHWDRDGSFCKANFIGTRM